MSEEKSNTQEKKQDEKQSWGEKIAGQIAGDNELLKSAITMVTHPIVLIGGLIALMFWLFNGKEKKEKVEKLEKENQQMKEELKGLSDEFDKLKERHSALRSRFFLNADGQDEEEGGQRNGEYLSGREERRENAYERRFLHKNRYRSAYLD